MQPNVPRDRLPAPEARPDLVRALPELHYPPRVNVTEVYLDRHVEAGHGGSAALRFGDETVSYAGLLDRVNRFGDALRSLGVEPGDRVVTRLPNRPAAVVAALAAQRIGAIVVPTMRLLRAAEFAYIANDVGATVAVVADDLLEAYEAARPELETVRETVVVGRAGLGGDDHDFDALLEPGDPDLEAHPSDGTDVAAVFYTSGTTGRPKGTVHTHHERLAVGDAYARHVLDPTPADVFGGNAPLPFSYGYGAYLTIPLRFGATASLSEDATPEGMLEAIEAHGITVIASVPTAYNQLLSRYPDGAPAVDTSSLRLGMSAGEPLAPSTYEQFLEAFGVQLLDGIGTTEIGYIFLGHRHDDEIDPGATGFPVPGYECRVVDRETGEELPRGEPGPIAIRGPTGITYWDRPDAQAAAVVDGWSYPGDVFVHREDGRFVYQSRADDVIISSGYKVPAPEVENAILELDSVFDVGVVGLPHPERNEVVTAFVVPADDDVDRDGLVDAVQSHVKATLAPYKYPRSVRVVDELPRTATGKIRRTELRARGQPEPAR